MQYFKLLVLTLIVPTIISAQPGEKIDILHTIIDLKIDKSAQTIGGHSKLTITPTEVVDQFDLFLQGLSIDSMVLETQNISFQHLNDSILDIHLGFAYQPTDTFDLTVYYHGQPVKDASGWGGFYFQSGFAFNLGVGFAADPHPFGRVWFPCKDNFTEKSTYTFRITTDGNDMALCNGALIDSTANQDGTVTWHWEMEDAIASYLVSVAVAPYRPAKELYEGKAGTYPIWYGGRAQDTADMKNSFRNLLTCIEAFEEAYGPQPFNRVGFALVPFGGGAMEHATNIAYPLAGANGGIQSETLMAHELSHHWWGNWVTCIDAEDMWLNEGWASWSEFWFLEYTYGKEEYAEAVFNNRKNVIYQAHKDDNGYRAIHGIPHAHTYGTHVYDKGADVAHTLRGYLGDEDFFDCIQGYLAENAGGNMSSESFRDYLTACSGKDLSPFFDGYVFNPGYPQYAIDSMKQTPAGNQFQTEVWIRQRLYHAPEYFEDVPLELTFIGENWQEQTHKVTLPGECASFQLPLDFEVESVIIDRKDKISTATLREVVVVDESGKSFNTRADFKFNHVEFNEDSILINIAHHLVTPDRGAPAGIVLSDNHYWKLDGNFDPNANVTGEVEYDGNPNNDPYDLDKNLITNAEDSVIILYRTGPGHEWEIWPDIVRTVLGTTDKTGTIAIKGMKKGEYALGIYDAGREDTVESQLPINCAEIQLGSVAPVPTPLDNLKIYPNPVDGDSFRVAFPTELADFMITVRDMKGHTVWQKRANRSAKNYTISVKPLSPGAYVVSVEKGQEVILSGKVVVK